MIMSDSITEGNIKVEDTQKRLAEEIVVVNKEKKAS